eukprot:346989-Rhodomonas_salina.1
MMQSASSSSSKLMAASASSLRSMLSPIFPSASPPTWTPDASAKTAPSESHSTTDAPNNTFSGATAKPTDPAVRSASSAPLPAESVPWSVQPVQEDAFGQTRDAFGRPGDAFGHAGDIFGLGQHQYEDAFGERSPGLSSLRTASAGNSERFGVTSPVTEVQHDSFHSPEVSFFTPPSSLPTDLRAYASTAHRLSVSLGEEDGYAADESVGGSRSLAPFSYALLRRAPYSPMHQLRRARYPPAVSGSINLHSVCCYRCYSCPVLTWTVHGSLRRWDRVPSLDAVDPPRTSPPTLRPLMAPKRFTVVGKGASPHTVPSDARASDDSREEALTRPARVLWPLSAPAAVMLALAVIVIAFVVVASLRREALHTTLHTS